MNTKLRTLGRALRFYLLPVTFLLFFSATRAYSQTTSKVGTTDPAQRVMSAIPAYAWYKVVQRNARKQRELTRFSCSFLSGFVPRTRTENGQGGLGM